MTLSLAIILFLASAIIIAIVGTLLTRTADQLADLTGMGEALFGAIFLGAATSLPGILTSVVAAYKGSPQLAVSNAIGGIAAQTFFLAIADVFHRRINLEHAAASFANLLQSVLLIGMLAFVLVGFSGPSVSVLGVSPFSVLLLIVYIAGLRLIAKAQKRPMWSPISTEATVQDTPDEKTMQQKSLRLVIAKFVGFALIVAAAGYTVAEAGIAIAEQTGLSQSFVGTLFTAVATSLPELIVSISAVRQKALNLAVGNIIGGNSFDVLFVAFADFAYREGSILHASSNDGIFIISITLLMKAVLLLGLLHRQRVGLATIGWESVALILLYLAGNAMLFYGIA